MLNTPSCIHLRARRTVINNRRRSMRPGDRCRSRRQARCRCPHRDL